MSDEGEGLIPLSRLLHWSRHPEDQNHALSQFDDRVKYSLNGLGNTLAIARQQLRE